MTTSQASRQLTRHLTKTRFPLLPRHTISTTICTFTVLSRLNNFRLHYHTTSSLKMPESIGQKTLDSKTDPSVSQQYDNKTPMSEKLQDLYKIIDGQKVCMMTTTRKDIGDLPVSRCMAVSKRVGPDLLFLANKHSQKFDDFAHDDKIMISFHDNSSQDWISMSGRVSLTSSDDERVHQLYTPMISAWFGDVGDGVHNGTANDPRMTLVEVKTEYVAYWKKETTSLGFVKEVAQAAFQGNVAQTGSMRQIFASDLEAEREKMGGTVKGGNDNSTLNVS